MKLLAIASLVILLAGCAFRSPTLRAVGIVEYGRFEKKKVIGTARDEAAPAKKADMVADAKLIEQTTEIPAVLGTSFGMRVKFIGGPTGATIRCTAKCLHPKTTDPDSGRTSESEEWEDFGTIGRDG